MDSFIFENTLANDESSFGLWIATTNLQNSQSHLATPVVEINFHLWVVGQLRYTHLIEVDVPKKARHALPIIKSIAVASMFWYFYSVFLGSDMRWIRLLFLDLSFDLFLPGLFYSYIPTFPGPDHNWICLDFAVCPCLPREVGESETVGWTGVLVHPGIVRVGRSLQAMHRGHVTAQAQLHAVAAVFAV